jgi:hypothetical protein
MARLSISAGGPCSACKNLDLDHLEGGTEMKFVPYSQASEQARLQSCLSCTLLCRAMEAFGEISIVGDIIYVRAENGKPFYINWIHDNGTATHVEIYRHRGEF